MIQRIKETVCDVSGAIYAYFVGLRYVYSACLFHGDKIFNLVKDKGYQDNQAQICSIFLRIMFIIFAPAIAAVAVWMNKDKF